MAWHLMVELKLQISTSNRAEQGRVGAAIAEGQIQCAADENAKKRETKVLDPGPWSEATRNEGAVATAAAGTEKEDNPWRRRTRTR